MRGSAIRLSAVVGAVVIATGCGSSTMGLRTATDPRGSGHTSTASANSMVARGDNTAEPSETASMICSEEIRLAVQQTFGRSSLASGTSTWVNDLYTCTYQTPTGPLVLSVQDATDQVAGRTYFQRLRAQIRPLHALHGLEAFGLPSYESAKGHVIFLKDGKTLHVDATALQGASGAHHLSQADVAYAIAADVIGCWRE
jgi:hypothetical protein